MIFIMLSIRNDFQQSWFVFFQFKVYHWSGYLIKLKILNRFVTIKWKNSQGQDSLTKARTETKMKSRTWTEWNESLLGSIQNFSEKSSFSGVKFRWVLENRSERCLISVRVLFVLHFGLTPAHSAGARISAGAGGYPEKKTRRIPNPAE